MLPVTGTGPDAAPSAAPGLNPVLPCGHSGPLDCRIAEPLARLAAVERASVPVSALYYVGAWKWVPAPRQNLFDANTVFEGVIHMSETRRAAGSPRPRKSKRRPSGKARVAGALLYVLFVIGLSAILATMGWVWACDLLGLNKEYASTIITIDEHSDFGAVVDQLEEEGLIEYKFLFKLYAWFSHAENKISAGTYELNTEMDYRALIVNMGSSSSTRQVIDVTIPEGYTIDQTFDLLEKQGVSSVDKLRDMAANWNYAFTWLQDLPLGDYHRLEGYLFPDTYTFYLGEDPKYALNKMLVNFDDKMDQYMADFEGDEATYSLHDIVTIASMIEKETDSEDYRTISSVLYNRLENPSAETYGYLQVDATLWYINGNNVPSDQDKGIDSPYNTYMYQGLPAGPISNPGMASLYAAMNPDDTNYYYYALNPETGRHQFSTNYAAHQALLDQYANHD